MVNKDIPVAVISLKDIKIEFVDLRYITEIADLKEANIEIYLNSIENIHRITELKGLRIKFESLNNIVELSLHPRMILCGLKNKEKIPHSNHLEDLKLIYLTNNNISLADMLYNIELPYEKKISDATRITIKYNDNLSEYSLALADMKSNFSNELRFNFKIKTPDDQLIYEF